MGIAFSHNTILSNTVIINNQAQSEGSGLLISRSAPVHLSHLTIAHNTGDEGSGIYIFDFFSGHYSHVAITNAIIVNQTVGITVATSNTLTLNGVLWHNNALNTGGEGVISVTRQITGDPMFAPDGYHLMSGSPAIDAGVETGISTDVDGQARPGGSGYDLGADEFWPPPPIFIFTTTLAGDGLAVTNGSVLTVRLSVSPTWSLTQSQVFTITNPNLWPGLLLFTETVGTSPAYWDTDQNAIVWIDSAGPGDPLKSVEFLVKVRDFASIPIGRLALTNTAYVRIMDPEGSLPPSLLPGEPLWPGPYGDRGAQVAFHL